MTTKPITGSAVAGAVVLLVAAAAIASAVSESREQPDRCFMWRIDGEAGSVHLMGSIHFMRENAYPLDSAIERAYTAADTVVFETDLDDLGSAAVAMMAAGVLEGERTLADELGDELNGELERWLDGHDLGAGMFIRMKPWMAALTLTSLELQRGGYLGSEGIDAHFAARAKADGKRRVALESVDFQVSLFAEMTDAQGAEFLRYTLTELETVIPLVDDIVAAWSAGDAARLETLLLEGFDQHPELFEKLVTDRNRRWLPALVEQLSGDGDALVVVGALHLVGDQGLVELLRAEGYEPVQVPRLGGGA